MADVIYPLASSTWGAEEIEAIQGGKEPMDFRQCAIIIFEGINRRSTRDKARS